MHAPKLPADSCKEIKGILVGGGGGGGGGGGHGGIL